MAVHGNPPATISISQIVNEFGGTPPNSLSEYRRGGIYVPATVSRPYTGTCYQDASTGTVDLGSYTHPQNGKSYQTFYINNYFAGGFKPYQVLLYGSSSQTRLSISTNTHDYGQILDTGNNNRSNWQHWVTFDNYDGVVYVTQQESGGAGFTQFYMQDVAYTYSYDCTLYQDVIANTTVPSTGTMRLSNYYNTIRT